MLHFETPLLLLPMPTGTSCAGKSLNKCKVWNITKLHAWEGLLNVPCSTSVPPSPPFQKTCSNRIRIEKKEGKRETKKRKVGRKGRKMWLICRSWTAEYGHAISPRPHLAPCRYLTHHPCLHRTSAFSYWPTWWRKETPHLRDPLFALH